MTFPERIAAIRKEMKFSQEKFGELAGVSQRTVAFWEAGERMPSHATISGLADRLGVSVDFLLPDPALSRVSDFLDGIQAGQEVAAEQAADTGPAASPAE